MKINFKDIENALKFFEKNKFSNKSSKEILVKYPEVMSYMTSNQFNILSDDEYFLFSFHILLLLKIAFDSNKEIPVITAEIIEAKEALNWEKFENIGNMPNDKKTLLLFGSDNEDLANFLLSGFQESDDEDTEISQPAREVIAIAVKSILDCF